MKNKLLNMIVTVVTLLTFPTITFATWPTAVAPTLGTTANYAIFTGNGDISNISTTYLTRITGNTGTFSGTFIHGVGFGNIDGQEHFGTDIANTQCETDLTTLNTQLTAETPDSTITAAGIGNDSTLLTGIYYLPNAVTTLNLGLTLDAKGNANAVFIFQFVTGGTLNTNANSKINLINGAKACNVFWLIPGAVTFATGTTFRGTIVSNAAINISTGDTLEGRVLTTNGAFTIDNGSTAPGVLIYTPIGCGSPTLTGPPSPNLLSTATWAIFSGNGALTNSPPGHATGDVGNNGIGAITGWTAADVTGHLHLIQDDSTIQCAKDLDTLVTHLSALPFDIQLLDPTEFGHNLILTPHTYLINGAVTFTDSIYLNAEGDPNAVFVIQINGAVTTSTYSNVVLINQAQAANVYWMVTGASVNINNYSIFNGNIIGNPIGTPSTAINLVNTGIVFSGRALTTIGAITTGGLGITLPNTPTNIITQPSNQTICAGDSVSFVVKATGIGLTYQWRKGNVNVTNSTGHISGATSDTLTFNPASILDSAYNYNVIISGTTAGNDTSANVYLKVNTTPSIITAPVNTTICSHDSVSFVVKATGSGITYQWRKGNVNVINNALLHISGATSDTLTFNPANILDTAYNYNVVIAGTCPKNDTSANVYLKVNTPPSITTAPVNKIICSGDSVSFVISATGSGITYQWRKGNVNVINNALLHISGATSDTLTFNPANILDTAYNYNVVIAGTCPKNDTSANVSLKVNIVPSITAEPVNKIICSGDSVSFVVKAIGTGITYQWRKGITDLISVGNIKGTTSDTLTFNPVNILDSAYNYSVVIAGTCPKNDTSINVSLKVNPTPTVHKVLNQTLCDSSATTAVTFSGIVAGTIYNWTNNNTSIGLPAASGSGNINSFTALNNGTTIETATIVVTPTANGCTGVDTVFTITVNPKPTLFTVSNQTVTNNTNTSPIIFSGGVAGTIYNWTNNKSSIGLSPTGSGNISSFTAINTGTIADTATITVTPTANGCSGANQSFIIIVDPTPTVNAVPNQTLCNNASITAITFSGTALTYNWTNNNTSIGLPASGSGNINPFTAINTGSIADTARLVVTPVSNGTSGTITSFTIIVNPTPVAVINSNSPVCEGSAIDLTAQTVAGGTYLWTGPNGFSSENQNPEISFASVVQAGNYSLNTSSNGCASISSTIAVVVNTCGNVDFFIPEGFSPNGDGINDLFVIRGIENYPDNSLQIFNRWGNKVFDASPYQNTWNGTSSMGVRVGGDILPIGTYFYLFNLGNGTPVIKGTVYLSR